MNLKINGTELYYQVFGLGEPLVFSHGWLDDCSIWDHQIDFFARQYSTIVYDHRGHGQSAKPAGSYSVDTLSTDLKSLMKVMELQRTILLGFSLGGMVALRLALEYPDMISKLVLVGTTARMRQDVHLMRRLWPVLPYSLLIRIILRYRFYKPTTPMITNGISRASLVPRQIAHRCLEGFTRDYDIRDRIHEIKVPTLIIVGDKDRINLKASKYLHQCIEGSKLLVIPECGHTVMVEEPEEFNEAVYQFIVTNQPNT